MNSCKIVLFIVCFVFAVSLFSGFVSAASLNITEVKQASYGVKNYTEAKSDIPGYVVVSNKNSTAPSFLKTITTWILQINNGVTTPVTISSVSKPTSASGSATGTLSKSEYLSIATNVKNFITTNGRVPNYASSSLGNIRYESLVYTYSKIIDFYKNNDRLPNSVSVVNIAGVSGGVVIPPLDYIRPTVTVNPTGGTYITAQTVTITATDNKDPHPLIFYTTDGTTPTTSSILYTNSLKINVNTVLKFMARDASGNQAAVQTMNYIINRVTDITTNKSYSTIQSAIDDASTLNGDIIQVRSGTYLENIVVTKSLTLKPYPDSNVTIQALNTSNPVIKLNCKSTTIQGFTIKGATNSYGIYLDALNSIGTVAFGKNNIINGNTIKNNKEGINARYSSNNTIENNSITNNSQRGIYFFQCTNNIIKNNIIVDNGDSGILFEYHSDNNSIEYNKIDNNCTSGSGAGIVIYYSDVNVVRFNDIINNEVGLHFVSGTAIVNYNRIALNDHFGLKALSGATIIATNNWWGTNNPTVAYSQADILMLDGSNVIYNPWLILKANASNTNKNDEFKLEADLTSNNEENNASSSGNIPNNIPVNFLTNLGTIQTTAYTNKGKATSILTCATHGEATITVSLDSQNVKINVVYGIYNQRTKTLYGSIQQAINSSTTSPGDTIIIDNGNYTENLIINKKINLIAGNGANPIIIGTITVNSGGNNTIVDKLTINGHINIYADNCTIRYSTIIGKGFSSLIINNSDNTTIAYNTITSNGFNGIQINGSSLTIHGNYINGCINGIYSVNSNNTIISNTIINNNFGVYTVNSTDTIQFNRITGNTYGVKNEIGTVNAINNWWGSNVPIVSLTGPSDINNVSGTVTYNPYLILSINVSSTNCGGNTSVTADLTDNNRGLDNSSQGFIPDGTPINFATNNGIIVSQAYTVKGQAKTVLNLNSLQTQNVKTSASLDHQSVSTTGSISTGIAVLNLTSTAIDNSTGQPLNITYNIPLNESITWLSILWTPTIIPGISNPSEEIQIIINGNIVLNRYIYNINGQNNDNLTFNLTYPGVNGFNITLTDPKNQITNLNFPGNVINRSSKISYTGSPYDGVKSFAIATTKVTKVVFNNWLNQKSLYLYPGGMSDAYATFMTSLMVVYAHDFLAEDLSSELNITWSRTHPVIITTTQNEEGTNLTLECDHSMGMTAIGLPENLWVYNFITSLSLSSIEYVVMNGVSNSSYQSYGTNGAFSSVVKDMLDDYNRNNESLISFLQEDYLVIKDTNNYNFIVIDLDTGVVRDINTRDNFCGSTLTYTINPICCFVAAGDPYCGFPITFFGNPWNKGTTTFYWDGIGKIFLASSQNTNPFEDQIKTMGELKISSFGDIIFNPENPENTWVTGPAIEINPILIPEWNNTVNLTLNASGDMYGTSSLWLIQVITDPPIRSINTTNLDIFTKKSIEDSKWYKVIDFGTGLWDFAWGLYFYRTSDNRENSYYYQKIGNDLMDKGWDRAKNAFQRFWS